MSESEWWEKMCQDLADRWNEAVLLIEDPPPSEVTGYRSHLPCAIFLSDATEVEKRASVKTFHPKKTPVEK